MNRKKKPIDKKIYTILIRVTPKEHLIIKDKAEKHFGGNVSKLIRKTLIGK